MAAGLTTTATGASAWSRTPLTDPHVYVANSSAWAAVRRSVISAATRLRGPGCGHVLTEFADASGRSLRANLDASTSSIDDYLFRWVWFVDDSASPQCRRSDATAAYTAVGDRVVRICPAAFVRLAADPASADVIIIHEVLHTLGLPENPPSSVEITRAVERRCGS